MCDVTAPNGLVIYGCELEHIGTWHSRNVEFLKQTMMNKIEC